MPLNRRILHEEDYITVKCGPPTNLDCVPHCNVTDCFPSPPSPVPVPDTDSGAGDHHLSQRLVLTFSLLSAFLFLSLFLSTIIFYRRRLARRRRRNASTSPLPSDLDDLAGGGGGGEVHHVWYIRTVGLDEATIESIAAAEYRTGAGMLGASGGDCPVCLGEFRDGDRLRLLPRCGHAFHVPCIDTWLRAHVNCPLCRSLVVDPTGVGAAADFSSSETEVETSSDGVEQPHEMLDEVPLSDSPAETPNLQAATSELQPVRRSASMDSPMCLVAAAAAAAPEDVADGNEKGPNYHRVWFVKGKDASSSSSSSCQMGRLGVGRSLSSSGRGFFFSRNARIRSSSSVLPL